jgi:L-seryl-tRNA(Ser) seleniumtransferase
VDKVLQSLDNDPDLMDAPRALLRDGVNAFLDALREDIAEARITDPAELSSDVLAPRLTNFLRGFCTPSLRRVINATGVVAHTNLGRSLLAESAVAAVAEAARRYSNLEFDLATGERGSRYTHVVRLLTDLTGAQDALVVNNNAAAVLLVLETLAKGREVIVSRGELVEIGGSFRIPEVMARSGAVLREVGATNRTHLRDYEQAVNEHTAALLKVHASNYRIIGFTSAPPASELRNLADQHGVPFLEDLGSGSLHDFTGQISGWEPTVRQALEQGAHVCTFSGDKLLGGPQAGIIVGERRFIEQLRKNPLNRALRIDKLTLAGLQATLRLYLDPEQAMREVPTLRMILAPAEELKRRANGLARALKKKLEGRAAVSVEPGLSRVGGGAFPEADLPTSLVAIRPKALAPDPLRNRLLQSEPPLIGRIDQDAFLLDPRTIDPKERGLIVQLMDRALA